MLSEYHKIETLFDRNSDFTVNTAEYRKEVFRYITEWDVTEKVDGTNIRIMLESSGDLTIGGRTNNAQMPADLFKFLSQKFTVDLMKERFWDGDKTPSVCLYGEGYGPGIQKGGGLYRADKSFILFDCLVDDKWWLRKDALDGVASDLGCEIVPYLGRMTVGNIVEYVRNPFHSAISSKATAEGIVARPPEPMYDAAGKRIIFKLKTRDFFPGKQESKTIHKNDIL